MNNTATDIMLASMAVEPPDPPAPPPTCRQHSYVFMGVVYSDSDKKRGSGAKYRRYEDKFFCKYCIDTRYLNPRDVGSVYCNPLEGTTPK